MAKNQKAIKRNKYHEIKFLYFETKPILWTFDHYLFPMTTDNGTKDNVYDFDLSPIDQNLVIFISDSHIRLSTDI